MAIFLVEERLKYAIISGAPKRTPEPFVIELDYGLVNRNVVRIDTICEP
jgi:hypothetical protein